MIGGARPQHVVVHSHDVKAVGRTGGVHALEEDGVHEVVALVVVVPRAQLDGLCHGPTDHNGIRVHLLDPLVGQTEQLSVCFGVHGLVAPFRIDIGFIPDLIETDPTAVSVYNSGCVVGEVSIVVWGPKSASRRSIMPAPRWRRLQSRDNLQPVLFG